MEKTIVMVPGGFDPLHIGHVRLINEAKKLGDHLIVLVNNDNWLKQKKGYTFMPEEDRKEILENLKSVDEVILTQHKKQPNDMSVIEELITLKPDVFANGGDRKEGNVPEYKLCKELGIEMAFNVGGEKVRSSSELAQQAAKANKNETVVNA